MNIAFIVMVFLLPMHVVKAETIDIYEQQKINSHLLINLFLEKVEEDGLTVFDKVLGKADLLPHHVSYVHNVGDDNLRVQLCFALLEPIDVPDFEDFVVDRITVEMDKDGNIIEISTHVYSTDAQQNGSKEKDSH